MEAILRYYPSHTNLRKENGYTALHYAAGSNYADYVALMASHVRNYGCNFKLGVHKGESVIQEAWSWLVHYAENGGV